MYTNKVFCMARTKELLGVAIDDSTKDLALNEMLEISKGINSEGLAVYRPYYAAAKYVLTYVPEQKIVSADGVTFRDVKEIYTNLMEMQRVIDLSLFTILPPGMAIESKVAKSYNYGIKAITTKNVWGMG